MPTSVIGNAEPSKLKKFKTNQNGFTLVEVMVVMVIIAVSISLVVMALPNQSKSLKEEAEILAARIKLVADTAPIRSSMTGIELSATGYRFSSRRLGAWVNHPTLGNKGRIFSWPQGVSLSLSIEGEDVDLVSDFSGQNERAPDLYFLPSGETSPFLLTLRNADQEIFLSADAIGHITIKTDDF